MMYKVAGEFLLALFLLQIPEASAEAFMPTFVRTAVSEAAGVTAPLPLAQLPHATDRVWEPRKTDLTAVGLETFAQSVVVFDADSGALLYVEEPDTVRAVGSISKLVTAMVFLDARPNLSSYVTVVPEDFVGGGRVYIRYRDAVLLGDVLTASLVGSDNTATEALVRLSGLSRETFLANMNAKAEALSLSQTRFVDPSGLSAENRSTAREVAHILAQAAGYPEIVARTQMREAHVVHTSGAVTHISSTNALLNSSFLNQDIDFVVGKTGFIPQAGYCFTGAFTHDSHRVYVAVLGADTEEHRFTDAANVTDWVFKTYTWPARPL